LESNAGDENIWSEELKDFKAAVVFKLFSFKGLPVMGNTIYLVRHSKDGSSRLKSQATFYPNINNPGGMKSNPSSR